MRVSERERAAARLPPLERESVFNCQPTGPNPLYHCDYYLDRPRAMGV